MKYQDLLLHLLETTAEFLRQDTTSLDDKELLDEDDVLIVGYTLDTNGNINMLIDWNEDLDEETCAYGLGKMLFNLHAGRLATMSVKQLMDSPSEFTKQVVEIWKSCVQQEVSEVDVVDPTDVFDITPVDINDEEGD